MEYWNQQDGGSPISKTISLDLVLDTPNIATLIDPDELKSLGQECHADFMRDLASRDEWERRYSEALKLAMQYWEEKTYPWPNASNVKFPLMATAMMQFIARAYPATVPGYDVVGCRIIGDDPQGEKAARAERISSHMSYQCMEEDTQWEESHDKMLITLSIIGSCFKKVYSDPVTKINTSEVVLPADLVVNYYTKSLDTSPCVTQFLHYSENDVRERVLAGKWIELDSDIHAQPQQSGPIKDVKDQQQGVTEPEVTRLTPWTTLEQHRFLDLDGDGYAEPYIVTLIAATRQVVRIAPRFIPDGVHYNDEGKVVLITPEKFFVKYEFIPSPDGGFYGIGFGALLGPLNHAIDTTLNQIIDAGHLKNMGGGFASKGVRMTSGQLAFQPGEWKRVESMGEDLSKNFYPLPVAEPSKTLYETLNMLIEVGFKLAMATDALQGENPGQNTKNGVQESVIEQGEKVFNGIYKRIYRALKEEFKMRYRINYLYPPKNGKYEYSKGDKGGFATYEDYSLEDHGVIPSADPFLTNQKDVLQKEMTVRQMAATVPGYNRYEVEKRVLKAMHVHGIDIIFPDPKSKQAVPKPIPEKVQVEQIREQGKQKDRQIKFNDMLLDLQEQMRVNSAKIAQLMAQAALMKAQAKDIENDHMLDFYNSMLESAHKDQDRMLAMYEMMNQTKGGGEDGDGKPGGMGGVEHPPVDLSVQGTPAQ